MANSIPVPAMLAFGEYDRRSNSLQYGCMILSIEFLFNFQKTLGLPISPIPSTPTKSATSYHDSIENLDLRLLDYHLTEDTLGDDLLLEFKSNNLSGIVRLNRVDDSPPGPHTSQQRKGSKKDEEKEEPYDQKGAMYFAVSVVSLYGLSIGVLVAFSLRRDWDEDEVKHFQRSWVKMDHMMEKQEKQRAKKLMTKAIIAINEPNRSSVATMTSQAVFMALAPAISFNEVLAHGGDHSRMRANMHQPLGTIAEATGGTGNSSGPTESSSPAISAITVDDGPVRSPPASRSSTGQWDDEDEDDSRSRSEADDLEADLEDNESEELEEIERILEEGQLETQLSVEMPDGDFDLEIGGIETNRKGNASDRMPLVPLRRSAPESTSVDSDEVFLKPEAGDSLKKSDPNKAPLRTLLGLLSPSLPFMDDELGPSKSEEQPEVWTSLTGQRSTQV